ncbi:MAG TPA: hypothetical protein DD737_02545, partial [Ruminococcaceae bacterium]|nr:hypothetical protein [Oscillospiraceae bacterium]
MGRRPGRSCAAPCWRKGSARRSGKGRGAVFDSLRGTLARTEPGAAVVECGGVGFLCHVSANTLRALPRPGGEVKLLTRLQVREDALTLFGFATASERNCFQMLTGVSGVGPKVALAILSV